MPDKKEEWYTTGFIPVDMSADEEFLSGPNSYDPGRCHFKCLGWYSNPTGKGKAIVVGFLIMSGPTEKNTNKGRILRKTFNLEDGSKSRAFFKGLCRKLGGDSAFVQGKPNVNVIANTEFDAEIFEREGTVEDKKTGKPRTVKNYEIDGNTIVVTKPGGAASANNAGGLAPTE